MINDSYGHRRISDREVASRLSHGDRGSCANRVLHLAFRDGALAGCCSSTIQPGSVFTCCCCGHWGLLAVAREAQGAGVASALVAAAERRLAAAGCAAVQIEYEYEVGDEFSERLRQWYEGRLGFRCLSGAPGSAAGRREFRLCHKLVRPTGCSHCCHLCGEHLFPKQRVEGLSHRRLEATGLRRFEHLPPGYTLERADLGGGSFAKVFLVRNDFTGDLQALKRVDRERASRHFGMDDAQVSSMIEQEFWHMQRTTHPHIIKLFDFFQDARYAYYVMEAVNGGTLKELAENTYGKAGKGQPRGSQKLSEAYVAEMLQQAAYALHHLHEDSRIHMDVKLENLMLLAPDGPPHLVLIDLGIVESFT
ncbi:unnamed protein product, partial [Prorocentrum cordatum]